MQILFIIAGMFSIAFGMLGSMADSDAKTVGEWTCSVPTQSSPQQRCVGSSNAGSGHVADQFLLAGIALEIAAAAVAIGGRRDAAVPPVPYAMPGQPPYPPRPMAPTGVVVPAQSPQPGWPSA